MLQNQLTSSTIFLRKYFCTSPVLLQYSQIYLINIFSPELLLQVQSLTLLQYLWLNLINIFTPELLLQIQSLTLLQYLLLNLINIFTPELLFQIQSLTLLQYLQLRFSLQFYSIICNSNSVFSFPPVSETQIQSQVLLLNPCSRYSLQFYYRTLTLDTVSSSTPVSTTQIQSPVLPQYLQLNLINIFSTKSLLQIKSQGLLKHPQLLNFINNFSTEPFLRIKSPTSTRPHQHSYSVSRFLQKHLNISNFLTFNFSPDFSNVFSLNNETLNQYYLNQDRYYYNANKNNHG